MPPPSSDVVEHRTVIIVGGGPAGLGLSAVLGGWHPHFSESPVLRQRYPQIADYLGQFRGSLLELQMREFVSANLPPVDLFRLLHHPQQKYEDANQIALEFRQSDPVDYLLITQEEVGGLWNNAPENLLTLSPGQWMELAFYPLAQHVAEVGLDIDVNDLIGKRNLIEYYHRIPQRFEQQESIRTGERVTRIEPHEAGFLLTTKDVSGLARQTDGRPTHTAPFPQPEDDLADAEERQYTCKYLVYAAGQRCMLRRLEVDGEDLPFVDVYYDKAEDYDGERALVVGGGRSADWAATELHDAGKQTYYSMRQGSEVHWRLINDSRLGLPYYARIAEILESRSPLMEVFYDTVVQKIEPAGEGGVVTLSANGTERHIEVDHVVKEIGGWCDYEIFHGFPKLQLVEQHDPYRFQVHQVRTHPHNYESVDVDNLYLGGYLAQGLGLVIIAMHGATYAIAADILQKEGRVAG